MVPMSFAITLFKYSIATAKQLLLFIIVDTATLVSLADPLRRRWGHSWPSIVISRHEELLSMDITVPSGWKVKPGQYVYLWLTQAGLRVASQLPFFNVSSWEGPLGASDTGAPTSELVDLSGQRAPIHASEQSASPEDTLREAETSVPDNTSLRSAEQGVEWRQVGPKRDAAVHPTIPRHISRGRASSNTAMGHRTLRVLARPHALVLGPYGRPPDLARFGIVLLIVEDIGIARVFSLIPTLVLTSEQHRAMVRKLIVVRQMEDLGTARRSNLSCLV
ncbi:hypothetical protein BDV12DRAFT_190255 [Aspergillus spectabilis]